MERLAMMKLKILLGSFKCVSFLKIVQSKINCYFSWNIEFWIFDSSTNRNELCLQRSVSSLGIFRPYNIYKYAFLFAYVKDL